MDCAHHSSKLCHWQWAISSIWPKRSTGLVSVDTSSALTSPPDYCQALWEPGWAELCRSMSKCGAPFSLPLYSCSEAFIEQRGLHSSTMAAAWTPTCCKLSTYLLKLYSWCNLLQRNHKMKLNCKGQHGRLVKSEAKVIMAEINSLLYNIKVQM